MSFFDILDETYSRISAIQIANGFNTDLGLDIRQGGDPETIIGAELPVVRAYIQRRDLDESSSSIRRATVEASMLVEALSTYDDDPNAVIKLIMEDLQKAIEIEPQDYDGLIQGQGISWQSDDIYFPRESSNIVGVTITYSVPHVRFYGDPTKP